MELYEHKKIEQKWREKWETSGVYKTTEDADKEKFYILDMFPYPSGVGLHVGHPKGYIATDIIARYKKMKGFNVLHPMGWDAFGLPAEQYALKNKVHPRVATQENIATFKTQIEKISLNYDWDREFSTTDPDYYKWTQWTFLQMFKKGLVYRSHEPINWCPSCKTGLANEDLEDGACERCCAPIEKKKMPQWVIKITNYADRMLNDLDKLDWQENIKQSQRNWIGRSEGTELEFRIKNEKLVIKVFTTRPDTLFGCTYMVLSPEHELIDNEKLKIKNWDEIQKYQKQSQKKTEIERTAEGKEKSGVKLEGVTAINPVNNKEIPIYIADYVLAGYGTGAIMAVPAHDQRDFEFAQKYDLPIKQVITLNQHEYKVTNEILEVLKKIKKEAEKKEIKFWLIGGLACAFYAKTIYRAHEDLDLVVKNDKQYRQLSDLLVEVNFKKREEKRVDKKLISATYNNKEGIDVEIIMYPEDFGMVDTDFEEDEKDLNGANALVVSRKSLINLKKYQVRHRSKDKDELDLTYLEGKVLTENGIMINSGEFDGMTSEEAMKKITEKVEGKMTVSYKLRDWVFGRQRYWGEPIPLVHCEGETHKWSDDEVTGVGFIVETTDGQYLWQKRSMDAPVSPGGIALFGGGKENGENPQDAVKRELKEELGIDCTSDDIKHMRDTINHDVSDDDKVSIFHIKDVDQDKVSLREGDAIIVTNSIEQILEDKNIASFTKKFLIEREKKSESCGVVPVPEDELPLVLPDVEHYEPTDTGESPLAGIDEWVNTECPQCGGSARRETDTMPQWAGSSWYYLRYIDPKNDTALVDPQKEKYWSPVDFYVGGEEHATRHLIYARFWHKFLFDIGVVSHDEPFAKLQTVGLIIAEDGRKMSKRWGNVINPDDVIERFGADTFRTYEMFMGPFDASVAWNTEGMIGPRKFIERIWKIYYRDYVGGETPNALKKTLHKTINKVGDDIEEMKYNTAISAMMILSNDIEKQKSISTEDFGAFLKILCPFAPHITQELWEQMGNTSFLIEENWPVYDEKYLSDDEIELVVQVNGKVRDKIMVAADIAEDDAKEKALASKKVQKFIDGKKVRKVIFVQGKLVSIVV